MRDDVIRTRRMGREDLPLCTRLSADAGWNQTDADWRRFQHLQPDGCFIAELGGQSVGTVTTCVMNKVGWIGMLLVDTASRGCGVGRTLLGRAIEFLESRPVMTMRLDATAMGRPMYENAGFVAQFGITRFSGIIHSAPFANSTKNPRESDWSQIVALDKQVVGYDRARLLLKLAKESGGLASFVSDGGTPQGYLISRPGRLAEQIGPCVAKTAVVGRRLFAHACGVFAGQTVIMDVPSGNREATAAATAAGLQPVRHFVRMSRGAKILEKIDGLWISSGPEKG